MWNYLTKEPSILYRCVFEHIRLTSSSKSFRQRYVSLRILVLIFWMSTGRLNLSYLMKVRNKFYLYELYTPWSIRNNQVGPSSVVTSWMGRLIVYHHWNNKSRWESMRSKPLILIIYSIPFFKQERGYILKWTFFSIWVLKSRDRGHRN